MAEVIENELRRELELAQAITHIGSWKWTIATGAVSWSDELYRIYGLEPGSMPITLDLFLSRLHPDERDRVKGEIEAVIAQPRKFAYRERIVRPDGSTRTLDTRGEAIVDERGTAVQLVGTCRDITDVVTRDERIRFYTDVFEHADIGLSAFQLDHGQDPPPLRLVAYNAATERLLGVSLAGATGRPLASIVRVFTDTAMLDVARAVAAGGGVRALAHFRPGTAVRAPILAPTLFALPGNHLGLMLEDVTARVRSQRIQAGERHALEMLAAGEPLSAILTAIVRAIEAASPDTMASILLLDETGTKMLLGAAPSLPAEYNAVVHRRPIGPRAGSCGTAMYRGQPVFAVDVETDPLWEEYREVARQHGLRSCWSYPIHSDEGRVLGTFALYHRTPGAPDDAAIEIMTRAAHVAGIVLERRALDEQRRALAGRIEQAREDERTAIARDLQDELGQSLTALRVDLDWVQRRVDGDELTRKLDDIARATEQVLHTVQRMASELRPGILDHLGLGAALEWQAEDFERRTSTPCKVSSNILDLSLPRPITTNVFRIFQEALDNIARHASASRVEISLAVDHGQLVLAIADDGIGLPEVAPRTTKLGILGMCERAWRLGGECSVKRRMPKGTVVTVTVPVEVPAERLAELET